MQRKKENDNGTKKQEGPFTMTKHHFLKPQSDGAVKIREAYL